MPPGSLLLWQSTASSNAAARTSTPVDTSPLAEHVRGNDPHTHRDTIMSEMADGHHLHDDIALLCTRPTAPTTPDDQHLSARRAAARPLGDAGHRDVEVRGVVSPDALGSTITTTSNSRPFADTGVYSCGRSARAARAPSAAITASVPRPNRATSDSTAVRTSREVGAGTVCCHGSSPVARRFGWLAVGRELGQHGSGQRHDLGGRPVVHRGVGRSTGTEVRASTSAHACAPAGAALGEVAAAVTEPDGQRRSRTCQSMAEPAPRR